MVELNLQQQMVQAAQERSNITKTLLAIQNSLDKMKPMVTRMEPVLASIEPVVKELPARRPGVDTAVGKLQTDIGEIRAHLAKIATNPFLTGRSSTMASSRCSTEYPSQDASTVSALTSSTAPTSSLTTGNVVPELAAPMLGDEALDVNATEVVAPAPAIGSTGGLDPNTDGDNPMASGQIPWSAPPPFTMPQDASTTLSWPGRPPEPEVASSQIYGVKP